MDDDAGADEGGALLDVTDAFVFEPSEGAVLNLAIGALELAQSMLHGGFGGHGAASLAAMEASGRAAVCGEGGGGGGGCVRGSPETIWRRPEILAPGGSAAKTGHHEPPRMFPISAPALGC